MNEFKFAISFDFDIDNPLFGLILFGHDDVSPSEGKYHFLMISVLFFKIDFWRWTNGD